MAIIQTKHITEALYEETKGKSLDEIKKITKNFASFLERRRLLSLGDEILEKFVSFYNEKEGIIQATILSRFELSEDSKRDIKTKLVKKYPEKTIELITEIDETLLAGIKIIVGDEVTDLSAKARLSSLERTLLAR